MTDRPLGDWIFIDRLQAKIASLRAERDALREALHRLHAAVCGETGFASAVRRDGGKAWPWPALGIADREAIKALGDDHAG